MKQSSQNIRDVEQKHAQGILRSIGITLGRDSHIRCPLPDHEDRNPSFRYDPQSNKCFCTCSAGSEGMSLTDVVMQVQRLSFTDALKHIESITGEQLSQAGPKAKLNGAKAKLKVITPEKTEEELAAEAERQIEEQQRQAEKLAHVEAQISKAQPIEGTPGEIYLRKERRIEGISLNFADLLYAPEFQIKEGSKTGPAMLAVVRTPEGTVCGLQATLIDQGGASRRDRDGKKMKFSLGSIKDGHVTLKPSVATDTVAIAEGVETGLTRQLAGPATVHVTLGRLRNTIPKGVAGRVEIIADVDKTIEGRQLAREIAKQNPKGLRAHVVAISKLIGDKADLNDLLQDEGAEAVALAVDDADRITAHQMSGAVEQLRFGSDEEIAQRVLQNLEDMYGRIKMSEGQVWAFNGRIWEAVDNNRLSRQITRFDAAHYETASGKDGRVSMSAGKVKSVRELMFAKSADDDFFKDPTEGISCLNCFVGFRSQPDGTFEPVAQMHARNQRARHMVNAVWPALDADTRHPGSDLTKLLTGLFDVEKTRETFADEGKEIGNEEILEDIRARQDLILEIAATAALGKGTKLKHPCAVLFLGRGGAGKSTVAEVIQALIPAEHRASVPPSKMDQDYFVASLQGKALNVAEEASERDLQGDSFKRIITGNTCHARLPYGMPLEFKPTAQTILLANKAPQFSGGVDSGVERRMKILLFDMARTEGETDEGILDRIRASELDLLLDLVVMAACDVLEAGKLSTPESSKLAKSHWMREADRVRAWAEERIEIEDHNEVQARDLYSDYREFCRREGLSERFILAANTFSKQLLQAFPNIRRKSRHGRARSLENVKLLPTPTDYHGDL